MFFRFLVLLRLLVTELAEVHDPAHGRCRVWGNFHQIHPLLPASASASLSEMTPRFLSCASMTRTSRARILPLTRTNEAEEKLRGAKGRLKTPSSVVTLLDSSASKKPAPVVIDYNP